MNTNVWALDTAHSGISFSVRHMVVAKVRGRFGTWTGELHFDATNGCLKRSLLGLYDSRRQSWFRRKQPGHQNGPGTTVRGLTLDGVVRQRRYGTGNHFVIFISGGLHGRGHCTSDFSNCFALTRSALFSSMNGRMNVVIARVTCSYLPSSLRLFSWGDRDIR